MVLRLWHLDLLPLPEILDRTIRGFSFFGGVFFWYVFFILFFLPFLLVVTAERGHVYPAPIHDPLLPTSIPFLFLCRSANERSSPISNSSSSFRRRILLAWEPPRSLVIIGFARCQLKGYIQDARCPPSNEIPPPRNHLLGRTGGQCGRTA